MAMTTTPEGFSQQNAPILRSTSYSTPCGRLTARRHGFLASVVLATLVIFYSLRLYAVGSDGSSSVYHDVAGGKASASPFVNDGSNTDFVKEIPTKETFHQDLSPSQLVFTPERPFQLSPGELPGYTGWARPERTLAGFFKLVDMAPSSLSKDEIMQVGEELSLTVQCQGHPKCFKANSWFYVRAYGPAILTGVMEKKSSTSPSQPDTYNVVLRPVDAGLYTVEVVLTFSDAQSPDQCPLPAHVEPSQYEGHLLPGFPRLVHVHESNATSTTKALRSSTPATTDSNQNELPFCNASQLVETSPTDYTKARWKLWSQVRSPFHESVTEPDDETTLLGYQYEYNSLGVKLNYRFNDCILMSAPRKDANAFSRLDDKPLHIMLIGDSNFRLQLDHIEEFLSTSSVASRVTFHELYGGTLRCDRVSGPSMTEIVRGPFPQEERRVIVFNTGLHDIHRLCGPEFGDDRLTYLSKEELSMPCTTLYKKALNLLVETVTSIPNAMIIFQTTTAAWPKYGNFGVAWDPRFPQNLPLDVGFIQHFNRIAHQVLDPYKDKISIVDGFWISLARPDNREVDEKSAIGKKLSHPGIDVVETLVRVWSMLLITSLTA